MTPPSRAVLAAFGLRGEPVALDGGEGLCFRVDHVVVKAVHEAGEAAWTQALLAGIDQDGFRVAEPVPSIDGSWVHDGWIASRFIPDLRPAAPRWTDIIECGLRFGAAAERARPPKPEVLDARTHRWAVADRVAWEAEPVELSGAAEAIRNRASELLDPNPSPERHVVHGDLSGNVFVDADERLVVLDVSPYLRHRRWAAAIVVADAVLWNGADLALAERFVDDPLDRDLFGRALIFRLVAEQLATSPRHRAMLEPYDRVLVRLS